MQFSELQKPHDLDFDLDLGSKSYWCAYTVEVYPHTKLDRNRKKFLWTYGRTDTPEFSKSISSSPAGDDLKIMHF